MILERERERERERENVCVLLQRIDSKLHIRIVHELPPRRNELQYFSSLGVLCHNKKRASKNVLKLKKTIK